MKLKTIIIASSLALGLFLIIPCNTVYSSIKNVKNTEKNITSPQGIIIGTRVGDKAPEIISRNPDGKEIKLSSLKGKVVLIDFWASWCGPCRRENPNVVSAYNKYKDAKFNNADGFAIYSVSLDRNKDSWMAAIQQDKLSWKEHVSELKHWNAKSVADYNVEGIPANFLIDANGIIVAANLRGAALHMAIDKLVKKL